MLSRCIYLWFFLILLHTNCSKDRDKIDYVENTEVKLKLIGSWQWSNNYNDSYGGVYHWLEFTEDRLYFKDSIINLDEFNQYEGEMQVVEGSCAIKYTFNDGIKHFNHCDCSFYNAFNDIEDQNIIWLAGWLGTGIVYDYKIENGNKIFQSSWEMRESAFPFIGSSAVRFYSNDSVAFYDPWMDYSYYFKRINY